jgi:hypothetical protein
MRLGAEGGTSAALFEKSAQRLVESPVKRKFFKHNSGKPLLYASFHDALCLDVLVTGVFRVRIEVIVIEGKLTAEVIHDVYGCRPACADRRIKDFRGRPGPDEPNAQIFEDVPDDRWVFDIADDPHGPLTFRTDQGVDFVDLLNKPRPVPPERLFIPQRFEDAGNAVIVSFPPPFPS